MPPTPVRGEHIGLPDDRAIGFKLCVWLRMQADCAQVRTFGQHLEIPLPKLRRPFCRLFFMRRDAEQQQLRITVTQYVDDLRCIQAYAVVAADIELRYALLTQHHDLLSQLQLHRATFLRFFVEPPRKPHRVLPKNRTALRCIHLRTCFLSIYQSCANAPVSRHLLL